MFAATFYSSAAGCTSLCMQREGGRKGGRKGRKEGGRDREKEKKRAPDLVQLEGFRGPATKQLGATWWPILYPMVLHISYCKLLADRRESSWCTTSQ